MKGARKKRGTEVIEVALLLPIMIILVFGTVEASFYFYIKHITEGAAREGVRNVVIDGNSQASAEAAITKAMGGLPVDAITWSPNPPTGAALGDPITVTVSTNTSHYSLPFQYLINTTQISGYAVMRKEY